MGKRIRSGLAACIRLALGPFRDRSRFDRIAIGAAAGVLVLAAIAMPVTVSSIASSHTAPSWVVGLCVAAGIIGVALIIKSCQRSADEMSPVAEMTQPAETIPVEPPFDHATAQAPSAIDVKSSELTESGIDIPEGSTVSVDDSILDKSPLRIRDKPKSDN